MTPQHLVLVTQAGYRACLSAYGGSSIGSVDRRIVLLRGTHWQSTEGAFTFDFLGLG